MSQQQHNKALHPTAYSLRFGRKLPSLQLPAAGELGRCAAARGLVACVILKEQVRSTSEVKMICFEVWVNGKKLCVAGIGNSGVLSAHVTWSQRLPEESSTPESEWKPSKTRLHVGGLVNKEHIRWTEQSHDIEVGDEVTFKVIEADAADEPSHKYPQDNPETRKKKRYEQYKLLKREFEGDESIAALEPEDAEEAIHLKARLMLEYKEEFEAWKQQKKQERE